MLAGLLSTSFCTSWISTTTSSTRNNSSGLGIRRTSTARHRWSLPKSYRRWSRTETWQRSRTSTLSDSRPSTWLAERQTSQSCRDKSFKSSRMCFVGCPTRMAQRSAHTPMEMSRGLPQKMVKSSTTTWRSIARRRILGGNTLKMTCRAELSNHPVSEACHIRIGGGNKWTSRLFQMLHGTHSYRPIPRSPTGTTCGKQPKLSGQRSSWVCDSSRDYTLVPIEARVEASHEGILPNDCLLYTSDAADE